MAVTPTWLDSDSADSSASASVSWSTNDLVIAVVRHIVGSEATPSQAGLPTFSRLTLDTNSINGAGTVELAVYYTLAGSNGSGALSFANTAFGYSVYKVSGQNTGGTNGASGIRQATGAYQDPGAGTTQTVTFTSSMNSGNAAIAVFANNTFGDGNSTPRSGWTEDADIANNTETTMASHSRTTTDTAASATYAVDLGAKWGIAVELAAPAASSVPVPRSFTGGFWN